MAFQYLLPGGVLKTELCSYLTNACTYSRIIKFFDLLISGLKIIEERKNTVPEDSDMSEFMQNSNAVLKKIKDVLATVSTEVLIQKLSGALDTEIKTVDKDNLESVLLKINNHESSITSLEYLESLINSFDCVVKLYFSSEQFHKHFGRFKEPVKDLTYLNRLFHSWTRQSAMNILIIILQLTIDKVDVTPEEKSEWQCLLLEAADVIQLFVEWDTRFQVVTWLYVLQFRSCVQCILDLLAECPVKSGIIKKQIDKINDCKRIYDLKIKHMRALPISDYSDDDDDEVIVGEPVEIKFGDDGKVETVICTELNDAEFISKIPPSHTWWKLLK